MVYVFFFFPFFFLWGKGDFRVGSARAAANSKNGRLERRSTHAPCAAPATRSCACCTSISPPCPNEPIAKGRTTRLKKGQKGECGASFFFFFFFFFFWVLKKKKIKEKLLFFFFIFF